MSCVNPGRLAVLWEQKFSLSNTHGVPVCGVLSVTVHVPCLVRRFIGGVVCVDSVSPPRTVCTVRRSVAKRVYWKLKCVAATARAPYIG